MKTSELIKRLTISMEQFGDLEVTLTGSTLPDNHGEDNLTIQISSNNYITLK